MASNEDKIIVPFTLETADSAKSIKEISKAIKDLKTEALAVGEGTEAFNQLTAKAGQLKDKLNDVNGTVKALAGNVAENLTSSFSKVASSGVGAFQAIAGAQALFGAENKDLQKTFVKLQALMSLSQGIKEFANIGQAAKDFKVVITDIIGKLIAKTAVTTTDTAVTEGATAAQLGLNAAMLANPVIAIIAGITALVGALYLFNSASAESIERQSKLNIELEKNRNVFLDQIDAYRLLNTEIDLNNELISENEAANIKTSIEGQKKLRDLKEEYSKKNNEAAQADYEFEFQRQNALDKLTQEFAEKASAIQQTYILTKINNDAKAGKEERKEKQKQAEDTAADEKKASEERIKKMQEYLATKAKLEEENATNAAVYKNEQNQKEVDAEVKKAQDIIEGEKYYAQVSAEIDEISRQAKKERDKEDLAEKEKERQQVITAISEFSMAVNAIGGTYSIAAGSIVNSFTLAFQAISDTSATTVQKVSASLQAIADTIGAINQLQREAAQAQLQNISASYNAQFTAIAEARNAELNKEGTTANQKIAIQNKYNQQEYQLKLAQYNNETAIKKKSFEQSKKLSIAQTIISGANAAINAFNSFAVIPIYGTVLGAAAAIAVAALTAKQVSMISQQKFDAGSPPSAPSFTAPSVDTSSSGSAAGSSSVEPAKLSSVNLYGTGGGRNNVGSDGRPMVLEATISISESEISEKQKIVTKYKDESKLGG